jgi:hypothetical protein
LTVHRHPTLSETVAFAAEAFEGTLTDLYMPKNQTARLPVGELLASLRAGSRTRTLPARR